MRMTRRADIKLDTELGTAFLRSPVTTKNTPAVLPSESNFRNLSISSPWSAIWYVL